MFPPDTRRCTDGAATGVATDADAPSFATDPSTRQALLDILTPRERDVLAYLVAGAANKVIAIDLGISMRTVEAHRAHILRKLGVRSVMALACRLCPYRAAAKGAAHCAAAQ